MGDHYFRHHGGDVDVSMTIEIDTYSKPRRSHIFKREKNDHYVEEPWCSSRLFDVEPFDGHIMDPACGWGNIVTNAPFDKIQRFTVHAVAHSRRKTAILFPLARLPAARYIERLPLIRIWLLAPR